jgi:HK97 family phage portal protein
MSTQPALKPTALERLGLRLTKRFHLGNNSAENPNVPLSASNLFATPTGANITVQTALNLSAVWAAVRVLTDAVAVLPNQTFERETRGKNLATDHHLYRLLKLRPNPVMTAFNYYEVEMLHLATWGNFYAEKQFNGRGEVVGLWPLRPDKTKPVLSADGMTKNYVTQIDGQKFEIPGDRVTHTLGLGFDGLVGLSVIALARKSLALTSAAEVFGLSFFASGAKIQGVLTHPQSLGEEATKALRESWEMLHNGMTNPHRIAVLEEGLSFEKIGVPPDDAQFLSTREFQISEIARWFKVPPHMIGDMSNATFSNIEQQSLDFLRNTLLPWLRRIEMTINHDVFPEADQEEFFAEFNIDGFLRGDSAARGKFYQDLFGVGSITPNEVRAMENKNPIDGGDETFVPLNFVPLSAAEPLAMQALEEPEPEPDDDPDAGLDPEEDDEEAEENAAPLSADARDLIAREEARERRQANAIRMREAAAQVVLPLMLKQSRKSLAPEIAEIRRQLSLAFDERGAPEFESWVRDFYESYGAEITRQFTALLRSYSRMIFDAVGEEVTEVEQTPELEVFLADYAESFGNRWAVQSQNELLKILRDSPADEVAADIEERVAGWEATRPGKHSKEETYRGSNAIARAAYVALNVLVVRWSTQGATCPLCNTMAGRSAPSSGTFLERGDQVEPDDDSQGPLIVQSRVSHPPLHRGCDCILTALL